MENVSEALEMAGMVLIFIVALSVCMSSFTKVRASIDEITESAETVKLAKDSDTYINYMKADENNAIRTVGAETVVSSMYRSIKENYVIYIKLTNQLDYPSVSSLSKYEAEQDIKVKNVPIVNAHDTLLKITVGSNQDINKILSDDGCGLYNIIKNMTFSEYLGVWQNNSDATSENKTTYRIITYIQN